MPPVTSIEMPGSEARRATSRTRACAVAGPKTTAQATFPWDVRVGSYLPQAERYLAERLGDDVAGRLQTGRSRNDQSGAAERLWMRDALLSVFADLVAGPRALVTLAERHASTLMPGYTHSEHAQPTTFGHAMMRHAAVLERDLRRLAGAYARTNLSALGGAAMAGTSAGESLPGRGAARPRWPHHLKGSSHWLCRYSNRLALTLIHLVGRHSLWAVPLWTSSGCYGCHRLPA